MADPLTIGLLVFFIIFIALVGWASDGGPGSQGY